MDETLTILPPDMVTLGAERPLRMAIDTPAVAAAPMVAAPETRASAAPSYTIALEFDWRRDEPMSAARETEIA